MGGNCCVFSAEEENQRGVLRKPIKITGMEESPQNFGKKLNVAYFKPSEAVKTAVHKFGLYCFERSETVEGSVHLPVKRAEADDFRYEGQVTGDSLHGRGQMLTAQGDLFICPFEHGHANGTGAVYLRDGGYFFGRIERGEPVEGKMIYPDESVYIGQLRKGKRHGRGIIVYRGGLRFEGTWLADLEEGEGKVIQDVVYSMGKLTRTAEKLPQAQQP